MGNITLPKAVLITVNLFAVYRSKSLQCIQNTFFLKKVVGSDNFKKREVVEIVLFSLAISIGIQKMIIS